MIPGMKGYSYEDRLEQLDSAVCVDYEQLVSHPNDVSWNEENWDQFNRTWLPSDMSTRDYYSCVSYDSECWQTIPNGYAQRETKWNGVPTFRGKQDHNGQQRPIERRHSGQGDGTKKDAERITYSRDFLMKIARLPISKEKPEFLPSLPVVLERPRERMYESGSVLYLPKDGYQSS
ncbi:uncharacterized protein C8orf88 homolog [Callorhinchus milii]|uniref:uncharacterized protein C8orf88 homolog n=1 Tax=Callorhinchus milii TaxID=7868 RepID=UPI001C3FE65B|nr:uncharacterized protein C8orf88 homolog [Callorhinchus milii]